MSKKKKRSVPVAPPKQEKKMVIDMNAMNLKKEHAVPGFRTGRHMTEKDRPRKKDWKREYYKSKEPERYDSDTSAGSFQQYQSSHSSHVSGLMFLRESITTTHSGSTFFMTVIIRFSGMATHPPVYGLLGPRQ